MSKTYKFIEQYNRRRKEGMSLMDGLRSMYDIADFFFVLGKEPFANMVAELCIDFAKKVDAHPSEWKTLEIISRGLKQHPKAGPAREKLMKVYFQWKTHPDRQKDWVKRKN